MEIFIIIIVLLIIVTAIFMLMVSKSKNKEESIDTIRKEEGFKPLESDVNMMNGINAGGMVAKPVKKDTKIVIPDFNKKGPIGYVDPQKTNNAYGDQKANNFNNDNKF